MRSFAVALLVVALMPTASSANGDPASDVLLGQSVFYPYSPPVSAAITKQLNAETAAAARAHLPIKVALIAAPVDLGVIPDLFGKPQKYAKFLDQEISFRGPQPLLVVMAAGYGVQGLGSGAKSVAASLSKPAGGQPNDLARAAIIAVPKLAAADGHPISGAPGGNTSGSSATTAIVVALAVGAVATAAALIVLRRRQAASP
jgi:hypothetical protein